MAQKQPKRPTDTATKAKAVSRWENEGGATRATTKHPKRPRDMNQWAKRMVDIATGQADDSVPDDGKDPDAVASGRRGGLKGGKARAAKLTAEQRAAIARKAAKKRWQREQN